MRDMHMMLLGICEFRKHWRREARTVLGVPWNLRNFESTERKLHCVTEGTICSLIIHV